MPPIGVDTGGTFTDFVTVDSDDALAVHKVASTPAAPQDAIVAGVDHLDGGDNRSVVHGTTVATNTVLEKSGARTALITTSGFKDVIEIGRGDRSALYDLRAPRPEPLVPGRRRLEVAERVLADGTVERRLTQAEARRLREAVRRTGAEAVAVSLLHSYATPDHERLLGEVLAPLGIPVSLGHELVAEFREFERTSTAVLNAYVQPRMARYVTALAAALGRRSLRVMQSGGGTADAERVAAQPVRTLLSGPVGGVIGALRIAAAAGVDRIITLDMGGTSTDVSLALGEPAYTRNGQVAGYPVQTSMVDIHTIGAGGGSVAEVDAGGALRVGPRSAGAVPGPVAYGKGGDEVTVTDADVFLGRIPAGAELAGGIRIDARGVKTAMAKLARRTKLTARRTAEGIVHVVVSRMARAVRTITLDRGHDPRDFTLVAFGGAAGLHAAELAEMLGIGRVLVPAHAGVLSAYGLVAADAMQERSRTLLVRGDAAMPERLERHFAAIEREAVRTVRAEGFGARATRVERLVDCRYAGQSFDLTVPFGRRYLEAFHREHDRTFGFCDRDRPVEAVTLRVRARGRVKPPPLPAESRDRPAGTVVRGPRSLPFRTSTTFVPRRWQATFDDHGGLVLTPTRGG